MLHIDKWADGRPRLLAVFAHTFASFPEELFGLIDSIKSGEINRRGYPLVPLQKWLSLYRDHRAVWRHLGWFTGLAGADLL